ASADLDYMHARYYGPVGGRFLSLDRVPGKLQVPQTWNRYAYTVNNPLRFIDPDGDAVTGFQLILSGQNQVPVKKVHEPPKNQLGLHNTVHGANFAFNVKIDFESNDKLDNYKVERD